jgi:hypothetical protein
MKLAGVEGIQPVTHDTDRFSSFPFKSVNSRIVSMVQERAQCLDPKSLSLIRIFCLALGT